MKGNCTIYSKIVTWLSFHLIITESQIYGGPPAPYKNLFTLLPYNKYIVLNMLKNLQCYSDKKI